MRVTECDVTVSTRVVVEPYEAVGPYSTVESDVSSVVHLTMAETIEGVLPTAVISGAVVSGGPLIMTRILFHSSATVFVASPFTELVARYA